MPKSTAPFKAPANRKWCSRHNKGAGSYLPVSAFPNEKYSYCRECKREYQREWDRTKRVRPEVVVVPMAHLSKDTKKIIIHLPNTERARNATRTLFSRWPDVSIKW